MSSAMKKDALRTHNSWLPMAIIGLLFFMFGFVTWLNGSLIPFLRIVCDLSEFQAMFVTFAFYIAYTVMAFPMSFLLDKTGYRDGMAIGLLIMVGGALAFIPAALMASYPLFLVALFLLGTGLTILQTASNPYVVLVGPAESAARRISILGILNKGAGVMVPLLFTSLILGDFGDISGDAVEAISQADRQALSARLVAPYLYMAFALVLLIGLVRYAPLPHVEPGSQDTSPSGQDSLLNHPKLILGAIAIFFYVGVEVIAGDTIGLYGQQLGVKDATSLTSWTMSFMVIGYIVGIFCIPRFVSQERALQLSAVIGLLCVLAITLTPQDSVALTTSVLGWTLLPTIPDTVFFTAMMGLANALVWPTVWPLALQGLGSLTARGSALLIMGIAGGALLPLLFGYVAEAVASTQSAYLICIPAYLYLLYYGVSGHKLSPR